MGKMIKINLVVAIAAIGMPAHGFKVRSLCPSDIELSFTMSRWGAEPEADAEIERDGTNLSAGIRESGTFKLKNGDTLDVAQTNFAKAAPESGARALFPLTEDRFPFRIDMRKADGHDEWSWTFTSQKFVQGAYYLSIEEANSDETVIEIICKNPSNATTWDTRYFDFFGAPWAFNKIAKQPEAKKKAAATPQKVERITLPLAENAQEWSKELAQRWEAIKEILNKKGEFGGYYADYPALVARVRPEDVSATWLEYLPENDRNDLIELLYKKPTPEFSRFMGYFFADYTRLQDRQERQQLVSALDSVLPFLFGTGQLTMAQVEQVKKVVKEISNSKRTVHALNQLLKERTGK